MKYLACLALLVSPVLGQKIVIAEGDSPTAMTIHILDESSIQAAGTILRTGVEFLPIQTSDQTAERLVRSDLPRQLTRQGLERVELPLGGKLVHYRLGRGLSYGFLLITPAGDARILLEVPGNNKKSPFQTFIGVAPDGRHAAAAGKGGEIFVMALAGGTGAQASTPTKALSTLLSVEKRSLFPGSNMLFYQAAGHVWRRPLAGGAPEDITPPLAPGDIIKHEMALSEDGGSLVFLTGTLGAMNMWFVQESGPARRLSPPPAGYESPKYRPDRGPRLLLSQDGSSLFYTLSTGIDEELFLLDTGPLGALVHLTSDVNFQPSIGTGILPIFINEILVLGIGRGLAPDCDIYAASTNCLGPVNLTMTNGNTTQPFGLGNLDPQGSIPTPSGTALVTVATLAMPRMALLAVDPLTGSSQTVAEGLRSPPVIGSTATGNANLLAPLEKGNALLSGLDGSLMFSAAPKGTLSTDVVTPDGAFSVFTLLEGNTSVGIKRSLDGSINPAALTPVGLPESGPQVPILTDSGAIILSGTRVLFFAGGTGAEIPIAGKEHIVLSGLGS